MEPIQFRRETKYVKFEVVSIFPELIASTASVGVLGRAVSNKLIDVLVHDLREFTRDSRYSVDDAPYGGGPGMVLKMEPFVRALDKIRTRGSAPETIILTSPRGRRFTHADAVRLSRMERVVVLCGRYEGIDERVSKSIATEEISIGDYVLSGGELPACVILDAVARQVPGVVGDDQSVEDDSFVRGLLDFPHYTRPAVIDGEEVPEVLLSGNHEAIRRWRKREAIRLTRERRPDLLSRADLDDEEQAFLLELE